ncbi:GfV-B65-ORF1 [Ichnoviriform fumiferanae]|uniref:GfV-B65-ORF1 n=1 Tax=Ichnoviriform fumiferanae TaxID=419435 RepID=A2PZW0_9VIRU|nr:GfV-B65-ORF1 [Ichnoviriform fumiferanae]BAF45532.1 GfV-B65-ORF1 [Ichnoviriform fumiferanae]
MIICLSLFFRSSIATMSGHLGGSEWVDKLVADIIACDNELQAYTQLEKIGTDEKIKMATIRAKKEMLIVELRRAVRFWSVVPAYIKDIILSSTM